MKILYISKKRLRVKNLFATIGIFDGLHLGHQRILNALIKKARGKKGKSAVVTFSPHPFRVLHPEKAPPMLLSLKHRLKILKEMGIDIVFIVKFDKHFAGLSAKGFVQKVLIDKLGIRQLFVGEKFSLGRNRKGSTKVLKKLSKKYGFAINIIKSRRIKGKRVSSTLIRKFVIEGRFKEAHHMLGRRFSVLGTVVHGEKRGRIIGFPTANLDLHHEAIPPAGVYAVLVRKGSKSYNGILNIGFRPTFKDTHRERTVEAHIFNFRKDIYGKDLEVVFIKKLRDERHFTHRDHLREQIYSDVVAAYRVLRHFGGI